MTLEAFLDTHNLPSEFADTALKWFKPLADGIKLHHDEAKSPIIVGINGCQGSGKSTLADWLSEYLSSTYSLNVAVCSLDDFYLSSKDREKLSRQIHPLLATRGVPGTHDTNLLEQVLLHCKTANSLTPLAIPRFDKATDNPKPRHQWPVIGSQVDILIAEGWCWGVRAQDEESLSAPINALEKEKDPQGIWRRYVNHQLQTAYEPLYGLMDLWVMLKAPSFSTVANWREEQEQKLRDAHKNDRTMSIMTKEQVLAFIAYFQRLTEHGLQTLPEQCHCVFELDETRNIISCQSRLGNQA